MSEPTFYAKVKKILAKIKVHFPNIEDFDAEINKIKANNGETVRGRKFKKTNTNEKVGCESTSLEATPLEKSNKNIEIPLVTEEKSTQVTINNDLQQNTITTDLNKTLKTPSFKELLSDFSVIETIIISLRYGKSFGYLERNYSIEEIASFLKVSPE